MKIKYSIRKIIDIPYSEWKVGDKVMICKRGKIDWESEDWSKKHLDNVIYTIKEISNTGTSASVHTTEPIGGYRLHPGHFKLINRS